MPSRPRYEILEEMYPDTVVMQLSGGFYTSYGKSAIALAEVTGYKLNKTTAGTYKCAFAATALNKVLKMLNMAHIGYIVYSGEEETHKNILENNEEFIRLTTDFADLPKVNKPAVSKKKESESSSTGENISFVKIPEPLSERIDQFCKVHKSFSREMCVNWLLDEILTKYNC